MKQIHMLFSSRFLSASYISGISDKNGVFSLPQVPQGSQGSPPGSQQKFHQEYSPGSHLKKNCFFH